MGVPNNAQIYTMQTLSTSQDQTTRIVKDLQAPVIEASLRSLLNDQVELGL